MTKLSPSEEIAHATAENEEPMLLICPCGCSEMLVVRNEQGFWIECSNCEKIMRNFTIVEDLRFDMIN